MENVYLEKNNKKDCNGCGICTLNCPVNAIQMEEDNEGFYYPKIDLEKCINCNMCRNICSNFCESDKNDVAYMAINKNLDERKNSASGGMFYLLAKYVIDRKGVVFGVEYTEDLKVRHNYYDTLEDCKKFQGSKYVRSNINDSYHRVKHFLDNDKYVLFTGTPCQCNALKVFLKKDYEKLILCDIICHANPSQKIFDMYIDELEKKYSSKIISYDFRSKENGWKSSLPLIKFENGKVISDKTFYLGFVGELFNRPSCNSCKFCTEDRVTDFTIGDFWGIDKVLPNVHDDDLGISLIIPNSLKSKEIFDELKEKIYCIKVDKNIAFKFNHNSNIEANPKRDKFFNNLNEISIIDNINDSLKINFIQKLYMKVKKKILRKIYYGNKKN